MSNSKPLPDEQHRGDIERFDSIVVPEFPVAALPDVLRRWAIEEAIATQTPVDLPALLAVTVCAAAIAKRVEVVVSQGWIEPTNIYTVGVLEPANRKSAVFSDATRPLREIEKELVQETAFEVHQFQVEARNLEARQKKAEAMAAKTGDDTERKQLLAEAVQLGKELAELPPAVTPRMVCDDCTPERLVGLMAEHGGRMFSASAEGGVFQIMNGAYSKNGEPMLDAYLKAHAGDEIRVDRVSRPPLYVEAPALTMALTVQPEVIRGLLDVPAFRGRGLLARILYSVPRSMLGSRIVRPPDMSEATKSRYHAMVKTLCRIAPDNDDAGHARAHQLRLEPAALEKFYSFMGEIEPKLGSAGQYILIRDWAGKLAGAVVRLAGVLHMAEFANQFGGYLLPISKNTVVAAIQIGHYLADHATVALTMMAQARDETDAQFLANWLVRHGKRTITKRDLHHGTKYRFIRVEDLEKPLVELAKRGMVRRVPSSDPPRAGRPASPAYEVHPALFTDAGMPPQNLQNPVRGNVSLPDRGNCVDSVAGFVDAEKINLLLAGAAAGDCDEGYSGEF